MTRRQQRLSLIVSGLAIPDLAAGLVEKESLGGRECAMVAFTMKNMIKTLSVLYAGQLPGLFHQGQGQ